MRMSLALVAAMLATTGCGGSSKAGAGQQVAASSAASQPTPAKSQMMVQAEAICERLNAKLTGSPSVGALTVANIVRYIPARATLERAATAELNALTPPASLASVWKTVIADRTALSDELEMLYRDARRNDAGAIKALRKTKGQNHKSLLDVASSAGFVACARVG